MKLESLNEFKKLKPQQTRNVFGGNWTQINRNTNVKTNGNRDVDTNPNDFDHLENDGGGDTIPDPPTPPDIPVTH